MSYKIPMGPYHPGLEEPYRGVKVVSAVMKIPDSPWVLLQKRTGN